MFLLVRADAIRAVNEAIREGGSAYLNLKQLEMTPQITAEIAKALAQAKMVNISGGGSGGNAAGDTASQLTGIVQTLLATRLIGEQLQSDSAKSTPEA